jgi:cysteine-rich repeat protein
LNAGTKHCNADGKSFTDCACDASGDNLTQSNGNDHPGGTHPTDTGMTMTTPTDTDSVACPGKLVALDPGAGVTLSGDTSTSKSANTAPSGDCSVATSKERVYQVIPSQSGAMTISLKGSASFDTTLYVREGDCATGTQDVCAESQPAGAAEQVSMNVVAGRKYYVFADGKGSSTGTFDLKATLVPGPFCGDGVVQSGELCDDGNDVDMDGCSPTCQVDGDPLDLGTCPGQPLHVWGDVEVIVDGTTTPYANKYQSDSCKLDNMGFIGGFGTFAPDRVYQVVAHESGTLHIELWSDYNGGFYVRTGDCGGGTQLACENEDGSKGSQVETTDITVTQGTTYFLIVDGAVTYKGSFELSMMLY